MPKSRTRASRSRSQARSRVNVSRGAERAGATRPLLERLLSLPHLDRVVPQLQPAVLHRWILTCGLEDCGELVSLATPDQIAAVIDGDVWSAAPGQDERLEPGRFCVWLSVLLERGTEFAARMVARLDPNVTAAALAQQVRVFDIAAVAPFETLDGSLVEPRRQRNAVSFEIGGYLVEARASDGWDAIAATLSALEEHERDFFGALLGRCRGLSNSTPETDGFHGLLVGQEQDMFDLAVEREARRERQGFPAPAQARAFLEMARQVPLGGTVAPPGNAVSRAHFRSLESREGLDGLRADRARVLGVGPSAQSPQDTEVADAHAKMADLLAEAAGSVRPRALLAGPSEEPGALGLLTTHLQWTSDRDGEAFEKRTAELAYLANVLMAGCPIHDRPFRPSEASRAASAVCNLGLDCWPAAWRADQNRPLPEDFLTGRDLIGVFQVGWTVLHRDVCLYSAERLVEILARAETRDRDLLFGLGRLKLEVVKHGQAGEPWRARGALDVVLALDQEAWATLLGLFGECPVLCAGLLGGLARRLVIDPSEFELIATAEQIDRVRQFLRELPARLGFSP